MPNTKRIFVSNRLPFSINTKTGILTRGSGGLVSALLGVSLKDSFAWMGFETDAKSAKVLKEAAAKEVENLQCYPVHIEKDLYDRYYDGFSNDILWPLFHYEGHLANFDRANWLAYAEANRRMAEAIAKIANPGDTVWIHDFHFMLVPEFLRALCPQVRIGFFLHIPFPSAELFRQLPVREEILNSLVKCDLIGFHEHSYLRHFDVTLKAILGVDSSLFEADIDGHIVKLGVYPISIDTIAYKEKSEAPDVIRKAKEYRDQSNAPFLILGIDRLDYTKGIELKLLGLQHAFKKYPELVGQVSLLQVAVPTRERVPAYRNIKKIVDRLVGGINGQFGGPNYSPVQYIFRSVPEQDLLALYRRADSVLVTSKRDGMNLVAMEYVIAQNLETPGTVILSEFAGAASLLSDALIINPWDVDAIADAIYKAYKMSEDERRERLLHMQRILLRYSATKWASGFLNDLEAIDKTTVKRKVESLSSDKTKWSQTFKSFISPKKLRLVLDYDGTVVALARTPERALLLEETKKLILAMHDRFEIFVLSGRPKEFLDGQFGDMPIFLSAEHGAFYKLPGGNWETRISSDIESWYPNIKKAMESYTEKVPLSYLETKSACLVWHYRESPEDFGEFQARKLYDELRVGMSNAPISVMMGSKIVEAKAIECNKGNFLRWLIQSQGDSNHSYICMGDDRTDEDMFKVLGDAGASIKIGKEKTDAQFRVANQQEVIPFFKSLIEYVDEASNSE